MTLNGYESNQLIQHSLFPHVRTILEHFSLKVRHASELFEKFRTIELRFFLILLVLVNGEKIHSFIHSFTPQHGSGQGISTTVPKETRLLLVRSKGRFIHSFTHFQIRTAIDKTHYCIAVQLCKCDTFVLFAWAEIKKKNQDE